MAQCTVSCNAANSVSTRCSINGSAVHRGAIVAHCALVLTPTRSLTHDYSLSYSLSHRRVDALRAKTLLRDGQEEVDWVLSVLARAEANNATKANAALNATTTSPSSST